MFLSLEKPHGKGLSIFAHNLVPEENFAPHLPNYNFDSERHQANAAITQVNEELGKRLGKNCKALQIFNQFNWTSTTGWEYWSEDYKLILRHALLVATALQLPVNVHVSIMEKIIVAAVTLDITFDFEVAQFDGNIHAEFEYTKRDIDAGVYFMLTDVRAPENTTTF